MPTRAETRRQLLDAGGCIWRAAAGGKRVDGEEALDSRERARGLAPVVGRGVGSGRPNFLFFFIFFCVKNL